MTVHATGSPYWLNVGGKWIHLEGVDPEVAVSTSRPSTSITTMGNVTFIQQAARVTRSWGLSFTWADPEAGQWLDYAATNPGDVWLLDQTAAQVNMLDARDTKGKGTTVSVEGVSMPSFLSGDGFSVKVRQGVAYALSFTTTRGVGVQVGTYDLGSGPVVMAGPAGTGPRRGSYAFIAPADGDLDVTWTASNYTTAARLTEGSVDNFGFMEGRSTPCRVAVSDVAANMKRAYRTKPALGDLAYTLTEIG